MVSARLLKQQKGQPVLQLAGLFYESRFLLITHLRPASLKRFPLSLFIKMHYHYKK